MKPTNKRQIKDTSVIVSFHKNWLNRIKYALGSDCTFISHVKQGEEFYLKAIIKNNAGGKDTVTYQLKGAPNTLTSNDYKSLLSKLKNKEYEHTSTQSLPSITE